MRDEPLGLPARLRWLAPKIDMPCASSGISSSSSVTTTVYASNGYGPNSSAKSLIIRGWSAKAARAARHPGGAVRPAALGVAALG